ncbi:c-type cytochrome [Neisseria perflava]|uniref:c-type cytochrome n=1 Tax=Neisseria perflava TaxID=33053 RepID=UPI00209E3583|nr:cytochrome c [Neisseria perflava]MCP1660667.1 mono/diheme cytochrome c family protein [Neisseria perflava]MCP1771885.1 mono/diheme cytochrome c family protein [Neisseria perflava]
MNTTTFSTLLLLLPLSAQAADDAQLARGQQLYQSNCAACHGRNGEGRGNAFPPLYQSDYIKGKPQVLIGSMVNGINGAIRVNGKSYNGFMPASALSDRDTAALASYIMSAMQNGGGTVTEQAVKKIRSQK